MSDPIQEFKEQVRDEIKDISESEHLNKISREWMVDSYRHNYSYHFKWMGRPVIQMPQDIVAMQEILWEMKPDVIIETGIAHGGSIILYASLMQMMGLPGKVIGVDIDIREHNRKEIDAHPMREHMELIEGSSIDEVTLEKVADLAEGATNPLVILDSNHTHDHVLSELQMYSPFVKKGGYLVVYDTVVDHMPEDFYPDRPWKVGDSPMSALKAFMQENDRFEIDQEICAKLLLTAAPDGYLKCIKD